MRTIPLTKGQIAIIDDDDWDRVNQHKWQYHPGGYARSHETKSKNIYLHRFIVNAPSGVQVDHINGNRLDCRKSNLRFATSAENKWNSGMRRNNTSGYKGVIKWPDGRWRAAIMYDRKTQYLGLYASKHEAAMAYNKRAVELFGGFARLNTIEGDN